MARSSTALIIILLLETSIAHEFRVLSKALSRKSGFLSSALENDDHLSSLTAFQVRGGSDYYRGDVPEEKDLYDDPYGRDNRYSSDQYGGNDTARSYQDDDRYGDYDDRDYRDSDKRSSSPSLPNLPNIIKNGDRRIGLALLGSGTVFTMLGISLFFNKSLMRLGNLLFIGGVPMTIGPGRTAGYFFQPKKSRATACLALGIFLVFIGSPVFGMILEIFGVLNLFGNMFPLVAVVMKQMPVVGALFGSGGGGSSRAARSSRDDERYDDDQRDDYRYDDDQYGRGSSRSRSSDDADERTAEGRYY